ncbi:MAG: DUF4097 family beta strand repeat-containing protein [Solirubrobacteraceae bacterium]
MSPTTATLPVPTRRTPRGVRIALVVIVALLSLATIAYGAWALLDLAARHTFERHAAYAGVRTLVVSNDVGDVAVRTAPAGSPLRVTTRVTEGLVTPEARVERRGGRLRLSATRPSPFAQEAKVGYTIAVPAGTSLLVDGSTSDLRVRHYTSRTPLSLRSSAGDIRLEGVSVPSLRLESSAGDIRADGVRAAAIDLGSSAGDITVGAVTAPRALKAESSAGDLRLTVPDVPYRVQASSSGGDVRDSNLRQDPRAGHRIEAKSSAGDVRIEPRR